MTEVTYVAIRSLISEYGTADAERIAIRLGWGAERLAAWLSLPAHGFDLDSNDMAALHFLCENGIGAKLPVQLS